MVGYAEVIQKRDSAGRRVPLLVDTVDPERAAFIKKYFHADWSNR
jgi:hypothetical protein